jgi:hypothetical protein
MHGIYDKRSQTFEGFFSALICMLMSGWPLDHARFIWLGSSTLTWSSKKAFVPICGGMVVVVGGDIISNDILWMQLYGMGPSRPTYNSPKWPTNGWVGNHIKWSKVAALALPSFSWFRAYLYNSVGFDRLVQWFIDLRSVWWVDFDYLSI